jgi:hypothetical protein
VKVQEQIDRYLESVPEPKQSDLRWLHAAVRAADPGCRLWFSDGKDDAGKVVSNPSIGYGTLSRQYADGEKREQFRVGISANSAGLSVYIMGLEDKQYLQEKYGGSIGKAQITGYCIKFKSLKVVDPNVLEEALRDGLLRARA